jgi:hypothetical protein
VVDGPVFVWKIQTYGDIENTTYTVNELIDKRKLFVWRGKNSKGTEITKNSVSNDGNKFTLNPSRDGYNKDNGLMSVVHEISKNNHVHVYDKVNSNDVSRGTERTIEQLISDGDLFVCDEIIESKVSVGSSGPLHTAAGYNNSRLGAGHGGKRKKSRKPKRRNSRSNRTLNKSKK